MLQRFVTLNFLVLLMCLGCIPAASQVPEIEKAKLIKDGRAPTKRCWDHTFLPGAGRHVTAVQDKIFISEANGDLRAISVLGGETIWMAEFGGTINAMHPVQGIGLLVVTTSSGPANVSQSTLRLLDDESGLAKYLTPVSIANVEFLKSAGSRAVAFAPDTGELEAFDLKTGRTVWKAKAGGMITAEPASFDKTIAVATSAKQIEFFSSTDGVRTGTISSAREINVVGFRDNEMLLTGDARGNVTNFRDQSGTIWWKFKSGAKIGTITETSEGILVGSYDNFVYMISKYSGDVRWKVRLDGRVIYRPIIAGGEAYFTVAGEDELIVIDTETGKILERNTFGPERVPIADAFGTKSGLILFPTVGGLQAMSAKGCK